MAKKNDEPKQAAAPAVSGVFPGKGWAVGRMKEAMFNARITAHSLPSKEEALKRAGSDPERFVFHIDEVIQVGEGQAKFGRKTKPKNGKEPAAEPPADDKET